MLQVGIWYTWIWIYFTTWGYLCRNKSLTEFLGIEVAISNCISFFVVQHQYQCPLS
ncbi:hypothetical protein F383_24124 [Gossypium arboreum]|uniref:Uncharacterized protein n=1 Tax=Gossypium arboreum TaxID=29729 RepID=A0A0B0MIN9_GOSAR|nr:hypothetical protein F383_39042 [Gossypium arboreum]KHG18549.1 hypothetical protein F383_24124 [Gossypium arboreum]